MMNSVLDFSPCSTMTSPRLKRRLTTASATDSACPAVSRANRGTRGSIPDWTTWTSQFSFNRWPNYVQVLTIEAPEIDLAATAEGNGLDPFATVVPKLYTELWRFPHKYLPCPTPNTPKS
jgi:hypothetical protein